MRSCFSYALISSADAKVCDFADPRPPHAARYRAIGGSNRNLNGFGTWSRDIDELNAQRPVDLAVESNRPALFAGVLVLLDEHLQVLGQHLDRFVLVPKLDLLQQAGLDAIAFGTLAPLFRDLEAGNTLPHVFGNLVQRTHAAVRVECERNIDRQQTGQLTDDELFAVRLSKGERIGILLPAFLVVLDPLVYRDVRHVQFAAEVHKCVAGRDPRADPIEGLVILKQGLQPLATFSLFGRARHYCRAATRCWLAIIVSNARSLSARTVQH